MVKAKKVSSEKVHDSSSDEEAEIGSISKGAGAGAVLTQVRSVGSGSPV